VDYVLSVAQEAEHREQGVVLSINSYIGLRRENGAVRACFELFEYVHGFELPDEVHEDPVFTRLCWQGVELVTFANDLFSFSVERAKGVGGSNLLTVAMKEKGLTAQEAANFVGKEIGTRLRDFLEDRKALPSFGEKVDGDVEKYVSSIALWYIGSLVWSFESYRYFGAERKEVKKSLVVVLKEHDEEMNANLF